MNETMKIIFGLVGGLAIFIYGMNMMSECLQKAAGEKMKKILALLTKNPILGVLAGALTTAVLQSSSATTVMTIGFVSAGLMSLPQAISIILGANIGTTMTAQIIAFKITDYIYLFIFVGFLISFISKKEKVKNIGQTIFAFGLLFLGIETMGDVMKPLASSAFFVNMIGKVSHIPILGVCVGAVMTLVVQSSSATIAVLQNFASQAGPDGVTSIIKLGAPNALGLHNAEFWMSGSLAGAKWAYLKLPFLVLVLCMAFLLLNNRGLNLLLLGDESAGALGINVRRLQKELVLVASLMAGVTIAVSGTIGFVGLMVPHFTRLLVGGDHKKVLPISALLGGILVVWVDVAARMLIAPEELPVGILTAVIGGPIFIWMLKKNSREKK